MAVHRRTIGRPLTLSILLICSSSAGASQLGVGFIQFTGRIVIPPLQLVESSPTMLAASPQVSSQLQLELRPQDGSLVSAAIVLPAKHLPPGVYGQCAESPRFAPVAMPAEGCHFAGRGGRVLLSAAPSRATASTVVSISYD
jgi:hypothetical protein